jgi:hypothetical protein
MFAGKWSGRGGRLRSEFKGRFVNGERWFY